MPPSCRRSAQIRPPWAYTSPRAIASPSPAPLPERARSPRQKRSNIARSAPGSRPRPVSSTDTRTCVRSGTTTTATEPLARADPLTDTDVDVGEMRVKGAVGAGEVEHDDVPVALVAVRVAGLAHDAVCNRPQPECSEHADVDPLVPPVAPPDAVRRRDGAFGRPNEGELRAAVRACRSRSGDDERDE